MAPRTYEERLATYTLWPHSSPTPTDMAAAGFHHSTPANQLDYVKCADCGISFSDWEPQDNPLEYHTTSSPTCAFLHKPATPATTALPLARPPPQYRSLSPAPPAYTRTYLTIDDLYMRYAPLKIAKSARHVRPTTVLPTLTIHDLYAKFSTRKFDNSAPQPITTQPITKGIAKAPTSKKASGYKTVSKSKSPSNDSSCFRPNSTARPKFVPTGQKYRLAHAPISQRPVDQSYPFFRGREGTLYDYHRSHLVASVVRYQRRCRPQSDINCWRNRD